MRLFGNLIFAVITRMFCGNHLNPYSGRTFRHLFFNSLCTDTLIYFWFHGNAQKRKGGWKLLAVFQLEVNKEKLTAVAS